VTRLSFGRTDWEIIAGSDTHSRDNATMNGCYKYCVIYIFWHFYAFNFFEGLNCVRCHICL